MENKNPNHNYKVFLPLMLVIISALLSCNSKKMHDGNTQNQQETVIPKKQYICSMHSQVVQDKPGTCPLCGMALIEKVVDINPADSMLNDVVLPVNESVISSIETVRPVLDNIPVDIKASGIINFDNRKIKMISARFGGLIERSYVKFQFQRIRKGQKIYEIFCPNIYTEHWNYIKIIQMYPDQDNLTVEARQWLNYLGLTSSQIESLKRTVKPDYHLAVYCNEDGFAVPADFDVEKYFNSGNNDAINQINNPLQNRGIGLNDGMTIETGASLFKVLDLKSLKADLKVKTEEIGFIRKGQKVIINSVASATKKYGATIDQIEPLNGGVFQLVKVYITDNEKKLIPGKQIEATIITGIHKSMWLPESSIVNMGKHKSVFVKNDNKFLATVIKTGIHNGNKIEILSGISTDAKVALNASLLIDSDGLIK